MCVDQHCCMKHTVSSKHTILYFFSQDYVGPPGFVQGLGELAGK